MSFNYPYSDEIRLLVPDRISPEDAHRQEKSAREVLSRLKQQPGIILADEVGMGKTFVALAVAASVALSDQQRRPVVVMVPSSLKEKWPREFNLFCEKCVSAKARKMLKSARAENAVDFLKFLDDPDERKKSIIFLTHGAMSRGLNDGWVKWAFIARALKHRKDSQNLRRALCRIAGRLLYMPRVDKIAPGAWEDLLKTHPADWLAVLHKYDIDPEFDNNPDTDDDPIPETVISVLEEIDTKNIYKALMKIPYRKSSNFEKNLRTARNEINQEMRELWKQSIRKLKFRLPLLVLDEAHHLKNAQTQLASLFHVQEAEADIHEISHGPLGEVFERMLFLTATPFQLGHYELCSVLERFKGIAWDKEERITIKESFTITLENLREKLDAAQEAAIRLDTAWSMLGKEELVVENRQYNDKDIEEWWQIVQQGRHSTPLIQTVIERFRQSEIVMKNAEDILKPWIIRHLKKKYLSDSKDGTPRRSIFNGRGILEEERGDNTPGLLVKNTEVLPFLLAARATACTPESRPVFAEGLASSYEAFLYTRRQNEKRQDFVDSHVATDSDDDFVERVRMDEIAKWYLDQLETVLPKGDFRAMESHPKVAATTNRVLELWNKREKVLVFCHYVATGRALRQHITNVIQNRIIELGAKKLGCDKKDVLKKLEIVGDKFHKEGSLLRKVCDEEIRKTIIGYKGLAEHRSKLIDVARRYIRTPSFLVRYFPLGKDINEDSIKYAFDVKDESGLSLHRMLKDFFEFLVSHCGEHERNAYIEALGRIQTGSHVGAEVEKTFSEDEVQGDRSQRLIANVRLVNGDVRQETRQKLMLTFNTPFYPEVMIASSVMAEGVDLHLNCRYVIHHDLCWNPSTLEQRTGRVDRIGSKAEKCGLPIHVYHPFVAETQDEKMFRVVMDRERWFKVVMGEKYKVDAKTTEKLAERVPLPTSAADKLAFRLEVV